MKKLSLTCLFALSFLISIGQSIYIPVPLKGKIISKISKELIAGETFKSIEFVKEAKEGKEIPKLTVQKEDGTKVSLNYDETLLSNFSFNKDQNLFWSYMAVSSGVYSRIMTNGFQYEIRNDLENESLDYLNFLEESNLIYEDEFIHDYLRSILLKIFPTPLNDGRTGQIDIRILKNNEPYAALLPNGTALISMGLLSLINSEEELIAVLAHEIAHFVLDHSVNNINMEIKRLKRSEFWANLTAVAVAATSTYISVKNDIYIDPIVNSNLIINSARLAYSISSDINERIGLKYSRAQESTADNCAGTILKNLGLDTKALASVLSKMKDYYLITGNYKVFSDNGTHPNIISRIEKIGISTNVFASKAYDNKIAFLLSTNAYYEYRQSHYKTSESLLNRLIESGSATEGDFILKSLVNLAQFNTEDKYQEALMFLSKAKNMGVSPDFSISKYEAMIHLRKNDIPSAQKALNEYKSDLEKQINSINITLLSASSWNQRYNNLNSELDWTRKMINKTAN